MFFSKLCSPIVHDHVQIWMINEKMCWSLYSLYSYFVFIVIVNTSVYFYVMFFFFPLQLSSYLKFRQKYSVGITLMFSPPEGDTSMFRCFTTIAMPFYLSNVFSSLWECAFCFLSLSEPPSQCTHSHLQYKHTPSKLLHLWSRSHLNLKCEQSF